MFDTKYSKAICYSGYRSKQNPNEEKSFPSYAEVKEDLLIISKRWNFIRLYDCGLHPKRVLEVIDNENLDIKVLLGAYINAEENNPNCPWGGGTHTEEKLAANRTSNIREVEQLIKLANHYPNIIIALAVGNEASVDWTDHLVPVDRIIEYVKKVQQETKQPVTFCENYVPWRDKLEPLAAVVDFISIHSYPVWEYQSIGYALEYTQRNYSEIAHKYPNKKVVITEAGWPTQSNGRGIPAENANEYFQESYYHSVVEWSEAENIIVFLFEAFDEDWKGSDDPLEPEKHWGLFNIDRTPKRAVRYLYTSRR